MKSIKIVSTTFFGTVIYWISIYVFYFVSMLILGLFNSNARVNGGGQSLKEQRLWNQEVWDVIFNILVNGLTVGIIILAIVAPYIVYKRTIKNLEEEQAEVILQKEEDEGVQRGIVVALKTLKEQGNLEGSTVLIMKRIEKMADLGDGDILIKHKKFIEKKIKELKE